MNAFLVDLRLLSVILIVLNCGSHSGARDDSIGLARATTNAYAGLRPTAAAAATTLTAGLQHLNATCARGPRALDIGIN